MAKWLTRLLFDWFFVLLYKLLRLLLMLVDFMEKIFDVFAGITKVSYNGQKDYLINVFFGQNIIAVIFWGMTAISVVLCFVFTVVAVTRKILDMGGGVKQSLGQILNGALRSCVSFLFVSIICIASVNLANICLIRIDYLMSNASTLLNDGGNVKRFTGEENAAMTRIMNTIANYSVNSSVENRYNINVCFNSIREDLLYLQQQQFFSYEYPMVDGHHTWQSAIALIAGSGDIGQDLELETVDSSVAEALTTVMDEIKYNPQFRPMETASRPDQGKISVATTIFLVSSMDAANSSVYKSNASFDDALRRSYLNGTKSYENLTQVRKDFDIWEMRYDVGYITCIVFVVIMTQCIFLFILRLFDLLLLYLSAPAFVSTIPLDDGMRFQTWRQAFTIKVISGFGSVMAMRLYLVLIQVIMDGKLRFFESNFTNYLCQLLFILGGSYAVLKASPLLTQIVAGNSGAAANSETLSAALGGIVGGKVAQTAGLGLKGAAKVVQAPGQIYRGAKRLHHRNQARKQAKLMSNEGVGIGKDKGKEESGNAAELLAPQSRGAAAGFLAGTVAGSAASGGGSAKGGSGGGSSAKGGGSGKSGGNGGKGSGSGNKFAGGSGARGRSGQGDSAKEGAKDKKAGNAESGSGGKRGGGNASGGAPANNNRGGKGASGSAQGGSPKAARGGGASGNARGNTQKGGSTAGGNGAQGNNRKTGASSGSSQSKNTTSGNNRGGNTPTGGAAKGTAGNNHREGGGSASSSNQATVGSGSGNRTNGGSDTGDSGSGNDGSSSDSHRGDIGGSNPGGGGSNGKTGSGSSFGGSTKGTSGNGSAGGTVSGSGSTESDGNRFTSQSGSGAARSTSGGGSGAREVTGGRGGSRYQTANRGPKLSGKGSLQKVGKGSIKWRGGPSQRGKQPWR